MKRIGTSIGPAPGTLADGPRIRPDTRFGALRNAIALAALMLPLAANSWAATETVLHVYVDTLSNENGGPISGPAMDAGGNLYGTTFGVGACSVGCGSVFKLTRQSNGTFVYQTIYKFVGLGVDGENPYGAPILDSAGNIYGTTTAGANGGVVYKLSPQSNGTYKETVLHFFGAFGSNDGTQPYSTLAFDKAGNLYGTTNQGGGGAGGTFCLNGCGTVFKLAPHANGTWTESVIHSFPGTWATPTARIPMAAWSSIAPAIFGARRRPAAIWKPVSNFSIPADAGRFSS